jgi:hypothetical protein
VELKETIADHERQLESLDCRISALEPNLAKAQTDLTELKSRSPAPIPTAAPVPPVSRSGSRQSVEFPLRAAKSLDGIILYLIRKHRGNVHEKGIVAITSKSVFSDNPMFAVRNVADLTDSDSHFTSQDEPDQWVCWDFHELRVRPTHYTLESISLKSWVVESSIDGLNWTVIDQQMDNTALYDLDENNIASFAVSKLVECRFIRLTQTGENHYDDDQLAMLAFEVFGRLIE